MRRLRDMLGLSSTPKPNKERPVPTADPDILVEAIKDQGPSAVEVAIMALFDSLDPEGQEMVATTFQDKVAPVDSPSSPTYRELLSTRSRLQVAEARIAGLMAQNQSGPPPYVGLQSFGVGTLASYPMYASASFNPNMGGPYDSSPIIIKAVNPPADSGPTPAQKIGNYITEKIVPQKRFALPDPS